MTTYANRTCHSCGARHPQPEMVSYEEEVKTGTSQRALMARNVFGWLIGMIIAAATGNRRMQRTAGTAVISWAVGNHKRQYRRLKTRWFCIQCCVNAAIERGHVAELRDTFAQDMTAASEPVAAVLQQAITQLEHHQTN